MVWRRSWEAEAAAAPPYARLSPAGGFGEEKIPRGYVPMVVGGGEDGEGGERVLVQVRLLKEPCMAELLELAAQQFGYGQQGVLRIPCDAPSFRRTVEAASRTCR